MTTTGDTIVAISSPPGRSARGLLRLSGPKTFKVLASLVHRIPELRTVSPARLREPDLPLLLATFQGPRSYTGEDTAELQLPGNPALLDRILHQTLAHGTRLAEPGEFTFRAYTAGKLDLTQAEGIAATITATSDAQLKAATLLRQGQLGTWAMKLVDQLGTQLALVEAGIDFVDQEDVVPIGPDALDDHLAKIEHQLTDLLRHAQSWSTLESLPRVVLVGPPSSGKSTLFNALLGQNRAVIHEAPGTTRDVLAEPLTLTGIQGQPVEIMLVDIAGLDHTPPFSNPSAQQAARHAIARADLILQMNTTQTFDAPTLNITSKADLHDTGSDLCVSALTGHHMDPLRRAIVQAVGDRAVSLTAESLALQPRHTSAIHTSLRALKQARQCLEPQRHARAIAHVEHIASHLRHTLDELAGLGGQLTPDDVIGRVFATFCVGK